MLPRGALIELEQHGNSVKVSAIDPVSFIEVSIVGPTTASQSELENLAVKKLIWRLEKVINEKGSQQKKGPPSGWDM
ncbi:serine hydroxymethyltransferase [Rhodospirillaceae bacterium RKSG073]|nr:serine hydroxymethyltransferase [Curvivirga aplysinae]